MKDIDRALDIGKNGSGGNGPKILGEISIKLVEVAPGQTQTTMTCSIADELQARGLYQKAGVVLEMILAQRAAQNTPRVIGARAFPGRPTG